MSDTLSRPTLPARMPRYSGPLLSDATLAHLRRALARGDVAWEGSLDLGRSRVRVEVEDAGFVVAGRRYPWPERCRPRTLIHFDGEDWAPVSRFDGGLVKLVPTEWDAPTFEIDGIKMLPTARVSPWEDAGTKVDLVAPAGRRVLDTCGGLGYFAAQCLARGATAVVSFEKNPSVRWLRTLNPWSPDPDDPALGGRLTLHAGDVAEAIGDLPSASFDAALHDPPRFGIAGELYAQAFYDQLARVMKPRARLFHYTGSPNRLTSGRDVPREVAARLAKAGLRARLALDGVLAEKPGAR